MKSVWIIEKIEKEAKKYSTRKSFNKGSRQAYKMAIAYGILEKVCEHMKARNFSGEKNPNFKWDLADLKKEASKYISKIEFKKNSPKAYKAAYRSGVLDTICSHMKRPPKSIKWTTERLAEEASKYKTRFEFQKKSNSAYITAQKRSLLDDLCSDMDLVRKQWTVDSIKEEALKYKTRAELESNSPAYQAARRLNILDQICSHMQLSRNISVPEQNLFEIIQNKYPKAQKLRDRKVHIEGKPHIQGFDIDLYVPELRKGIEFDGKYWHSIPGLKRSRSDWPKEDLENYHKLKDEHFKSRGIELFHVKEEDWIKDKNKCVNECLRFLGV